MKKNKSAILMVTALLLSLQSTQAGSATWNLNPTSGDWNTAANWTPATVPNGASDVATFDASNLTDISLPDNDSLELDSVVFTRGASAFSITAPWDSESLTFSGAGVINNSGVTQNFVTYRKFIAGFNFNNQATVGRRTVFTADHASKISFNNQASAGLGMFMILGSSGFEDDHSQLRFYDDTSAANASVTNTGGSGFDGEPGETAFYDNSTAANGTFTNTASTHVWSYGAGYTTFHDSSTAGDAVIRNRGAGGQGKQGGGTFFWDTSTAGNATIIGEGGADRAAFALAAVLKFLGTSDAGTATLIADAGHHNAPGGLIVFYDGATGNQARIELFGNGTLDLTDTDLTIGSLEGSGIVLPGTHTLTVGSNDLSTSFDGLIQDNGFLVKVGSGTLALTGANTYTGGTIVSEGFLRIDNKAGSATGSGPVQVSGGTLGGGGTTSGDTTVGGGAGGSIAPGSGTTTLSLQGTLTFEADGSYVWRIKTRANKADQVMANGVTINDGAQFNAIAIKNTQIPPGASFAAIANTATTPIIGIFSNLPDRSTIRVGNNTFQANYEGGDGNDLTLTVVP